MKPIKQTFAQEMHCCGDDAELSELTIEIHDGGAGEYVVIHATHWAIDDKNVGEFCELIKKAVFGCDDTESLEAVIRTMESGLNGN